MNNTGTKKGSLMK